MGLPGLTNEMPELPNRPSRIASITGSAIGPGEPQSTINFAPEPPLVSERSMDSAPGDGDGTLRHVVSGCHRPRPESRERYCRTTSWATSSAPGTRRRLKIRVIGTGKIKQLVTVKNQQFIYARQPNADEVRPEFTGRDFEPGSNYYYTCVVQTDGQVGWSSPFWVE